MGISEGNITRLLTSSSSLSLAI